MNIKISIKLLRKFIKIHPSEEIEEGFRYCGDEQIQDLVIDDLSDAELATLTELASEADEKLSWSILKQINTLKGIKKDPGARKCKRLNDMAAAMKAYLTDAPRHWIFEESDSILLPYFIQKIEYHPPDARNKTPAYIEMELGYMYRGDKRRERYTWHRDDLEGGKTVPELLTSKNLIIPTEKHIKDYEESMKRYQAFHPMTGEQFTARGESRSIGSRYYTAKSSMIQEGVADKLVMDDEHEEGEKFGEDSPMVSDTFWNKGPEEEAHGVSLPSHPFLKLFNLDRHEFYVVHSDQLIQYKWDPSLGDKLILPHAHKEVIQILMETASEEMDDIIRGKSGGTIVICTGEPGTGKTLTAEVTSEVIKRPLYKVNCSQLGTDEEEIEKELTSVLNRSARWKALLLIDEADVYVRTRENDIQQNAIVGVFLRVLEYYRGVLFLTSNRATVIDDAIMSRSTVHLKYEAPGKPSLEKIWQVLSTQFKLQLGDKLIKELVATFPNIVGRDVKNILKIVIRYSKRNGGKMDLELFKKMAVHKDIEPVSKDV